jgi:hypothetical protein
VFDAGDGAMRAGLFHGAIEFCGEGAVENVVDERGFSGAGHAGDDGHETEGQSDINIFQVVAMSSEDGDRFSIRAAAGFGDGDFYFAREVLAGE